MIDSILQGAGSGAHEPDIKADKRWVVCCAIIVSLTVSAFSPALKNGFTNWDDHQYITANPDIKAITPRTVLKVFSSSYVGNYQPVTMLTYMIDYKLFRLHAAGYHFTSIFFHVLNGVLVFWLIYELSGSYLVSFLTAALFAVHPLRVESVAWIAERKDVVASFFYFSSLILYILYTRFLRRRKSGAYYGCLAAFFLALLSKPMAVSLPLVLLLVDYLKERKINAKTIREKLPFVALTTAFSILTIITQLHEGAIREHSVIAQRIEVPFFGLIFYLIKTVAPVHLSALYPVDFSFFRGYGFLYPLLTIIIGFCVFRFSRNAKSVRFGVLFFILTILPVLQIVPVGDGIVANRYTYLPMIGMYYIAAIGVRKLLDYAGKRSLALRGVIMGGFGLILGVCGLLTYERCKVWSNSVSLWNDVLSRFPGNAIANNSLGQALYEIGRTDEAIDHFRRALASNHADADIYLNIGTALVQTGRIDEGIASFRRALVINHNSVDAHLNLGNVLVQTGRIDEGIASFRRVLAINNNCVDAHLNFGTALVQIGRIDEGIEHFRSAVRINPGNAVAQYDLGGALSQAGRTGEAAACFHQALELGSSDNTLLMNLGTLFLNDGQPDQAIVAAHKALENNPGFFDAHVMLGAALMQSGKFADAIVRFQRAVSISPADANVRNYLGTAFVHLGRIEEAIPCFMKALEIRPNDSKVCANLGNALLQAGRAGEAIHCFQRVMENNPGDLSTLNVLCDAFMREGRPDSAFSAAVRALALAKAAGRVTVAQEIAGNIEEMKREKALSRQKE